MDGFAHEVLTFITAHRAWAGPILFVTCFAESLAVVALLFPGTLILMAAGTLVPAGIVDAWTVMIWATAGAVLGDAVSFWIGLWLGPKAPHVWPFRTRPHLLERGITFFRKHGGKSVFIGRFIGPVRAIIPLAAGVLRMPTGRFWLANIASALVWAPVMVFLGDIFGRIMERFFEGQPIMPLLLIGLVVLGGVFLWAAKWWTEARRDLR